MPKPWALLLFLATLPTFGANEVTVQQLEWVLTSARGQADGKLNQQLQDLELTERLSAGLLARWQAQIPGPATRQTLLVLADESAFLRPPAAELPATPPPTLAEQRQMIARSADFAKRTISHLPDFYAARETLRFESDPATANQTEPMHPLDSSRDTILYQDGQEAVRLSAAERKRYGLATPGLSTTGVFGPILGSVLTDTAHGTLAFSHWEQGTGRPHAVFSYKIPQAESHYRVELGLEYRDHPAYHGEFAVDPESGTILRLTLEADLEKSSVVVRSAVLVEYGPVTIGARTYICPLKSVTINVFYPACTTTKIGGCGALAHVRGFRTQTSLNDVTFSQYHVFRADSRILSAENAPSVSDATRQPDASSLSETAEQPVEAVTSEKAASAPLPAPATANVLMPGSDRLAAPSVRPADASTPPAVPTVTIPAHETTPIFRVTPGIVYLDVVVRDRNHRVVGGLTQGDFRILEDGQPQTIDAFHPVKQLTSEQARASSSAASVPAGAPGTNGPPETINLILFDLLDTSPINQAYARNQMLKFLKALPLGQKIGLFVLTGHELRMVQSVTGTSAQLAAAASTLLPESGLLFQSANAQRHSNDATGSMPGLATPGGSDTSIIQDLAQDLASENFQHGQVRNQFAAEAFRALAKTTEGFNGRKNLFWLAESFPLSAGSEMLAASRFAVYPISVLGMQTNGINAEMNGNGVTAGSADSPGGGRLGAQISQQDGARREVREQAEQIAAQTGGEAFFDINDLAAALGNSLEGGENYYSLVYSPTDKKLNGKFRRIRVELARKGYSLSYRQGYFAIPAGGRTLTTQP
jgi:VWFA-related protein